VDAATPAFGPSGAPPAHDAGGHLEHVNADGFAGLVSPYRMQDTRFIAGDTQVCVTGNTLDGVPFEDCDAIHTLPHQETPSQAFPSAPGKAVARAAACSALGKSGPRATGAVR
jgi:hypothetical protein